MRGCKKRIGPSLLKPYEVLLGLSLAGWVVSGWAHVEALLGVDPAAKIPAFWLCQLLLLALVLPVGLELFTGKPNRPILRSPYWMKLTLAGLLAYYGANFYVFLYWSVEHLQSASTWRMVSAGWLLLFGLTAVFYWVRLAEQRGARFF